MQSLKNLWDGVDSAQKGWVAITTLVAAFLTIIGVRSGSMRLALESAAFVGCVVSYWFTVSRWAGKGRDACLKRRTVYLLLAVLPLFMVIAMLLVLEPDTARAWSAERIYGVLISSALLPNVIGFAGVFLSVYLVIGAIVLSSAKLWNYVFPP